MFVRNVEEIFKGKNICFQNEAQCEKGKCKLGEGVKTWDSFYDQKRCYCQKVTHNLFYLEWIALPIAFIISLFAIMWLAYLNRCINSELKEVNKKVLLLQESQDFFQESLLELMRVQNHLKAYMQEYNENNDDILSAYRTRMSETSGDQSVDDSPVFYELLAQFVGRFNLTNNLDSNNTLKEYRNITAFQDDEIQRRPDFKTDLEVCDLLRLLNSSEFAALFVQCDELDNQRRRTKRSNPRGKQNKRKSSTGHRGRLNNRCNIKGPVASHFKGAVPEMYIQDTGLVAPWFPDTKASADFSLDFEFREGRGTVEVTEGGLYMIYAQVYYLTTEILNSFTINVREKDQEGQPVAFCNSNAVVPRGGVTEVSCFTAVIRYLNATNQIYINQRDRNRRMILRDGHSFLGIIRLNAVPERKRRRPNRQ